MEQVTKERAKEMVKNYRSGCFFTVTFVKRSTGEIRTMNCRKGVHKHLRGGEQRYNPESKGLVCVWDRVKKDYRTIALESINTVSMQGRKYQLI